MSDQKTADHKAKKALKKAKKAVKKASKAVRHSSQKLQNQAAALQAQTRDLTKEHKAAQRGSAKQTSVPSVSKVAVVTPPLPAPHENAPTLIELREQAKARKIAGYSRLNKAALIEALG